MSLCRFLLACLLSALVTTCAQAEQATPAPIRFLLTFDDGPSAARITNPSAIILDTLANNTVQPGIKAVFFVQTRADNGGATEIGHALMAREFADGHVLALHTATPGHSNQVDMSPAALDQMLDNGMADIAAITGARPTLVRPPFWHFNARTLGAYQAHGLHMVLTDLSANDGKIYGIKFSWHKRSNMLKMLRATRERWRAGTMPVVDGATPVVVTFHDINTYTAGQMQTYLDILIDVARELEMPTAPLPFYAGRAELEKAAQAAAITDAASHPPLPGFWNWLWQ